MMITIDDIFAFIEKAIKKELDISTDYDEGSGYYSINIFKDNSCISFRLYSISKIIRIYCIGKTNSFCIKDISLEDIINFKSITIKADKYSTNKSIEYFNNFFKNKEDKLTINDLDNEDD